MVWCEVMSNQLLPTSVDCCRDPCRETLTTTVPGPQGDDGANGTNGTDGENAYTLTTDGFTMPNEGATEIIEVANSGWMVESVNPDGLIYVQNAGTFQVVDIPDATHAEIKNIADVANDIYPDNVAGGTPVASGQRVSPTGIQGPEGATPADALLASANLADVDNPVTSLANLGVVIGTADTNVAPVDEAGGLDAGEPVFATATGLETLGNPDAINVISPLTTEGDILTHDGSDNVRRAIGASGTVPVSDGTTWAWQAISSVLDGTVSQMSDAAASGTVAQLLAYGAWTTLTLTGVVTDEEGHIVSLVANQFILIPGTYALFGLVTPEQCYFRSRLRNVTAGTTLISGIQVRTLNNSASTVPIIGVFTVAAAQTLEWQYYSVNDGGGAGAGFGYPMTTGDQEIYKSLTLLKID